MAVGIGIVLIALGAILTWGMGGAVGGLALSTIGIVLMVVGAVGIAAAVLYAPGDSERRRDEQLAVGRSSRAAIRKR
jgi:drug/metabolite transporter (DMT)-like permease